MSRDVDKRHGIVFSQASDGTKEHSTTAVRINQFYMCFYSILRILLPTTFTHKKLLSDKIRTVHGLRPIACLCIIAV